VGVVITVGAGAVCGAALFENTTPHDPRLYECDLPAGHDRPEEHAETVALDSGGGLVTVRWSVCGDAGRRAVHVCEARWVTREQVGRPVTEQGR
jgi:hypothetical protein